MTRIRLFAYEIPVTVGATGANRVENVDLLGYNNAKDLYLIELKIGDSSESLVDTITQIRRYESWLKSTRIGLEKEFQEKFLLLEFTFTPDVINKIILAPKKYFDKNKKTDISKYSDIKFCYFSNERQPIEDVLLDEYPEIKQDVYRVSIYKEFTLQNK